MIIFLIILFSDPVIKTADPVASSFHRKPKSGANVQFDDYNRETKLRHLSSVEAGLSHPQQPARGSPAGSRSSSVSSDTASFSSDDSDVAEVYSYLASIFLAIFI